MGHASWHAGEHLNTPTRFLTVCSVAGSRGATVACQGECPCDAAKPCPTSWKPVCGVGERPPWGEWQAAAAAAAPLLRTSMVVRVGPQAAVC